MDISAATAAAVTEIAILVIGLLMAANVFHRLATARIWGR